MSPYLRILSDLCVFNATTKSRDKIRDKIVGYVSRRYTARDATQFRDAWAPHTQAQRHGHGHGVLAMMIRPYRPKIRSDKIVGFHDATRLATLHNSAMPGPLTGPSHPDRKARCTGDPINLGRARSALLTAVRNRLSRPCLSYLIYPINQGLGPVAAYLTAYLISSRVAHRPRRRRPRPRPHRRQLLI